MTVIYYFYYTLQVICRPLVTLTNKQRHSMYLSFGHPFICQVLHVTSLRQGSRMWWNCFIYIQHFGWDVKTDQFVHLGQNPYIKQFHHIPLPRLGDVTCKTSNTSHHATTCFITCYNLRNTSVFPPNRSSFRGTWRTLLCSKPLLNVIKVAW